MQLPVDQAKIKDPLGQSPQFLKGVGPERYRLLEKLGVRTLEDMMHLFPRRYEDRSETASIAALQDEAKQCASGIVVQKRLFYRGGDRSIFRLVLEDAGGKCVGLWFNCPYLEKNFITGQKVALYGKAEKSGTGFQMIHPDYEILEAEGRRVHTGRIVPVYPLTQDLNQRALRSLQYDLLLRHLRDLRDPLPASVRDRNGLPNKLFAIKAIHFPKSEEEIETAYRRLVFDEFFFIQLALGRSKEKIRRPVPGAALGADASIKSEFERLLPFRLTPGQTKAIGDVLADLKKPQPMHRLLQGDVGSGKTTVAAFALYAAARAGHQGAIMAPTEILAQQHFLTLSRTFSPAGIGVGLLTQGQSEQEKEKVLKDVASGECRILAGTHALIQKRVRFHDLRVAVIDEQHKFGVLQRKFFQDKSRAPNLLVMTATPIPRTLALTLYGDLDLSVMEDAPKGRGKIRTLWAGEDARESVYRYIGDELKKGRQAYFVHPLVEKSETLSLKDAKEGFGRLSSVFPDFRAGLLHGQMKSEEKKAVMKEFRENKIQFLISTSLIEVGIDVPNATVLAVENADRFGLSQLHQLRGRIGRGDADSTCILFSDTENAAAAERLRAFAGLESGFDVAEEDLRLRGPGDFFGERQHGIPQLRIGDLIKDIGILEAARKEAAAVLKEDPGLKKREYAPLQKELRSRFGKMAG